MTAAAAAEVRSFVDLRVFAAAADYPDVAGTADAFAAGRVALPLPPGPVAVAALALAGEGGITGSPADEFVLVLAGRIAFDGLVVAAGDGAVIPQGASCRWRAAPGTRAVVMSCAGAPGAATVVPIDAAPPLRPSAAPLAALLVGPTPACRNHTDFRSASGEFTCGTWDSTPYHRRPMRYRHYELMHLLAGAVTFTDEVGRVATFGEGDVFLIEQGAECSWLSTDHVSKVYAIHRPAGDVR